MQARSKGFKITPVSSAGKNDEIKEGNIMVTYFSCQAVGFPTIGWSSLGSQLVVVVNDDKKSH